MHRIINQGMSNQGTLHYDYTGYKEFEYTRYVAAHYYDKEGYAYLIRFTGTYYHFLELIGNSISFMVCC